ncbi:LexA-binding, inner membrane-associated putative hydrolase [uncultured archaeon]|nr:LexA-binding, inner membrane-associated putative hydrolase [uncultured archaeon]
MDFFSHALLPYLLGSFQSLERRRLAALVLGGIVPDLDVLITWINVIYPNTMLLVHRGITHTFLFGFLFGMIILYLSTRSQIKSLFGRFIHFDLDLSLYSLVFVYAGILIHLIMDFSTTRGVPLFYPFEAFRYSAEIFSQIELIIMIFSILILAAILWKRSITKFNKHLFILFIIFLLVVGGIRIEGRASAAILFSGKNAETHPDSNLFGWEILENDGDQFQVYEYNYLTGKISHNSTYAKLSVASDIREAEMAIHAAENLPQVWLFRWRSYAVAINATSQNDSWIIEYYDPLVKTQMANTWSFFGQAAKNYGSIQVLVENSHAGIYEHARGMR